MAGDGIDRSESNRNGQGQHVNRACEILNRLARLFVRQSGRFVRPSRSVVKLIQYLHTDDEVTAACKLLDQSNRVVVLSRQPDRLHT